MRRSQRQQGSGRSQHSPRPKKRTGLGPHPCPQIRGVSKDFWGYVRSSEVRVCEVGIEKLRNRVLHIVQCGRGGRRLSGAGSPLAKISRADVLNLGRFLINHEAEVCVKDRAKGRVAGGGVCMNQEVWFWLSKLDVRMVSPTSPAGPLSCEVPTKHFTGKTNLIL